MERSTLYVSFAGGKPLALARASQASPYCQVRFQADSVDGEVSFTCDGGDLLVIGVVVPDNGDIFEPPPKRSRVQTPDGGSQAAAPVPSPKKEAAKAPAPGAEKQPAEKAKPAEAKAAPKPARETKAKAAPQPASKDKASTDKAKEILPYAAKQPNSKASKEKPGTPVTHRMLASGLRYEVLKSGSGPQAMPGKEVKVRYEGRLGSTGGRFDKGVIKFRLGMGEVIQGWDQGVKGMLRGEKRRLLVPSKLGYGRSGAPPAIPPNADLVFEVELL
ncbi:fkbp4 [Symbiodinium microadriaticum]|nr:fkbp4 [Symbiodinium microadriaticum]